MRSAKRLLYLVTEDWYFLSHRLPMARAARAAGYEVHVATRVSDGVRAIEAEGFLLHTLDWRRGSMNPRHVFAIIRQVRALYRSVLPDLVHHVALQASVIGSLAALGLPCIRLNGLAGLGYGFTSRTTKARAVGAGLHLLLRVLLNRPGAAVLVQNPDDSAAVNALGVPASRVFLVPGSGVDPDHFRPLPEPDGPVTAAFVGRLLDDKGVRALVAARRLIAQRGHHIRLLIAGERDEANPASIPAEEIAAWGRELGIELLGHVSDVRNVWATAHIAVLPSRREGLPKSLLEAAACARPIVATDVPGCREIARHNVNALLVRPDDPAALAQAIARLAGDSGLRKQFGAAGRKIVETEFSDDIIGRKIVAVYDSLLKSAPTAKPIAGQAIKRGARENA
jgi:glycosyltransferase involved in cell wall biosynthesis